MLHADNTTVTNTPGDCDTLERSECQELIETFHRLLRPINLRTRIG